MTQMPTGYYMGVPTHWGGARNGGAGVYRGVYCPPPEHGCKMYCDFSYHALFSGSPVKAGNVPIQVMVVADQPEYTGDKGGACSIRRGVDTGMEKSEGEGE